jgi:hypothetical protein
MKWKDHQRLIRVATSEHHVPLGTYNGLLEGSIYPDKTNTWLKSQGKAMKPHHHINTGKIIIFVLGAALNSMQLILFAPVLGFIIPKMDSEYYLLKKKSNWFKME